MVGCSNCEVSLMDSIAGAPRNETLHYSSMHWFSDLKTFASLMVLRLEPSVAHWEAILIS